ncbi:hypothetical protein TrVFT333_008615 [Trichoderma virens FT-333]|nr:hypothetical protein TrVFT333_008615 [Trichoderma virens FT-333]
MDNDNYPQTVDLSSAPAAAQNPQEPNTGGKGPAIREPLPSVTTAMNNLHILWGDVPNKGGPATEAGRSQTTTTTSTSATDPLAAAGSGGGINGAGSGVPIGLSMPMVQALDAGSASRGHKTRDATICSGMSVSSMDTSDFKTDQSPYGTVNDFSVDHEVSHMGPWADDNIKGLTKKSKKIFRTSGSDDKHT